MAETREPTLEAWLAEAKDLGLEQVEIHHCLLPSRDREGVAQLGRLLDRCGLRASMLTCAPDFTHPDAAIRAGHLEEMEQNVQIALDLGAPALRVTTGCRYDEVTTEQGLEWCAGCLLKLAEYAAPRGVVLALENHYRDVRWTNEDFAFHAAVFLEVFRRIEESSIMVNFDASNQIMIGEDPMTVLEVVKHKVWSIHASDRFPGEYTHSVVGEGAVRFDPIFKTLAQVGFSGTITLEDGNPEGTVGTRRALAFLRKKIAEYWV